MAKINLLPWREKRRQERQQEFYSVIGFTLFVAAFVVYLVYGYFDSAIDTQHSRNNYISQQAKVLDGRIKEIRELKATRQQLIERMDLIQALQGNRPIIVHVFDEMALAVPDELYFTSVNVKGTQVSIKGLAKSNARVSGLMRNFDQSDWFADPALIRVQADKDKRMQFEISLTRIQPHKNKG